MESETKTPQFTVGQEIATFLVSSGLLPKVWEESLRANKSGGFTLTEYEDFVCVAFASFQGVEDFIFNQSKCGEDNIQTVQNVFSGCLNPALIHPGALTRFLHIMEKTDFQAKLQIYTDSKRRKLKPFIFVGHSIGGAIATLATLWVLERRPRKISPFCITFGCPLVGNERLVEAVGRENWGGNFCHVVSKHDIVARMLLAPIESIESIAKPFTTICSYWQGINVPDSLIQDAASTLLNQIFFSPSSPYRPFGTYMLCSSNGAACIQNALTVLEMLSLTMPSQQTPFDEIVQACLSEHIRYDSVLEEVLQNSIRGIRSIDNYNSESPYEMGILLQLEAIGVGAQNDHAQLALRKAGETEKSYNTNVKGLAIELSLRQSYMAELEWYKESYEKDGGIGYYDAFKNHETKKAIEANMRRVKLAEFWDDIIKMWENHELPSDFQSQNKWINAGNTYRKLVEPLDIAYYYRNPKGKGNYLSDGRPKRHKVLQEWMEAKEKTRSSKSQRIRTKPASLTEDSCFWAYVEEACKDLENLKQGQHESLNKLEKFEEHVTKMENDRNISQDVFFEGSRFMKWREEWKEYKKNQSPDRSSTLMKLSFAHEGYQRSPPSESSSPSNILTMGGFTVGQEIATFLVSSGLLPEVWEESLHANNSEGFTVNEHEDFVCVAFASFQRVEDFIFNQSKWGEDNIQTVQNVFSGCLSPALIHPRALTLFLHIMEKTDFQAKFQIYTDSKQRKLKPIIFVGHSIGGAIATLATLWVLEKRLRKISPFCITFGCPLLGNERLVEAVGRENWGDNFFHVVSKHDIVPRMLLAPIESIAKPFTTICSYWQGINVPDSLIQDAARIILNNVLVFPSSPYRYFGTYMLCSSNGAACVENAQIILEMLRLTMQSQQSSFEELVRACVSEHIRYDSALKEVMQNSIIGIRIANSSSESSYEMGISSQLEAIGVGALNDSGRSVLRGALVRNAQIDDSHLLVQLSHKKANFEELEFYKRFCEKNKGITYYDSFKDQDDLLSLNANFHRELLAAFWDEIVEMWESHELPSDFASQDKWINAGNTYRRLVEPLDIAHYYGMSNGKGNYLSDGRPRRHKVLQEWMEAKEKTGSSRVQGLRTKPASLTQDSCFWAHVEEALKDLESLKQVEKHGLQNLEKFEEYVTQMVEPLSNSSDVLWEGSSFMNWWKKWKEYNKAQSPEWSSPLYQIMESKSPLKFERIDSSTVAQEKISSTGEVKESIPSNKGSDLAQLSSKESELIPQQGRMFELQWYKMICHDKGDGYYDSFKNRNDKDYGDSKTNLLRVTLNEFWDGIIGICSSPSLPSDFQSRNKWINVGTAYRKLVEPLDIAQYYSTSKDSGNYLDKRPARYKVLEQWLEHRKTKRSSKDQRSSRTKLPFLTRDSCFWARVEEALKNLKGADQKKESLENFEKYVTEMIHDCKISSDVLLKGSSFMKWWRDYKEYKEHQTSEWKLTSPLYKLQSPFWKP